PGTKGAQPRFLHLDVGYPDLSPFRRPARGGGVRAGRPAARGNRRPVSGAGTAPRQAQRTGLGGRDEPHTGRAAIDGSRRARAPTGRQPVGPHSGDDPCPLALTPCRTYGLMPAGFVSSEFSGETVSRAAARDVSPQSRADFRTRQGRTVARRTRVREAPRVARRVDPRDGEVRPDERRQARAPGRAAACVAALRLFG